MDLAPHFVPKNSKAEFRTTIDLGPMNAATSAQSWPVPNIESEINDLQGHGFYAILDYVSSYWQIPLDPSADALCGIVCPNGIFTLL